MTILYDSSNHFDIIFRLKGTVWGSAILPCSFITLVYAVLWLANSYGHRSALIIHDEQESSLSLLVAFVIVVMSDIMLERFASASTRLMEFHYLSRSIALKSVLFGTGFSGQIFKTSEGCKIWRRKVRSLLIKVVDHSMAILQHPELCVVYCGSKRAEEMMDNNLYSQKDDLNEFDVEPFNDSIKFKYQPIEALKQLFDTVAMQESMLSDPLVKDNSAAMKIQVEMAFLQEIERLYVILNELLAYSTTPVPFPFINVMKISLFVWILAIPFFQQEFDVVIFFVVFFLAYAVVGLDAVANEVSIVIF